MNKHTTAKQNIANCPEYCYSVLLTDKRLIIVKSGEMGFYPALMPNTNMRRIMADSLNISEVLLTTRHIADYMNKSRGITPAQCEAMEMGSMFGWEIPGANPDNYDETGRYKSESAPQLPQND